MATEAARDIRVGRESGTLPAGWRMVRFGDVVRNVDVAERNPLGKGLERYVGLEHLDPESLHVRRWGLIEEGTSFTRRFGKGQVLFGKRRAYQRKAAVAEWDGICSGDILVFEAKAEELLPDLLPFIVQSDGFFEHALGTSAGSLSPRTRWRDLERYEFALPPKHEQRRIAEILWTADEATQKAMAVQAQVQTARQGLIRSFVGHFLSCHALSSLDSIIDSTRPVTYGILKPGLHFEGGIPVIKVKDYPDGVVEHTDLLFTDPAIERGYRRSRLRKGDLLLSIRGTIGRVAEVPSHLEGANITQDTARLSIAPEHNALYVRALLESEYIQSQIRSAVTGLAVQGINIGEVRKLKLPVPSRAEQDTLACQVDALARAQESVSIHLQTTMTLRRRLLDSLVTL